MPTDTTNYGLVKPATTENADISVINGNMDVIDSQMKANADSAAAAQAPGAATDTVIGNRTIDDTVAAATGADTPTRLWSKLANMIKRITGKSNWYTAPATTLEAANTHMNATTGVHGATSAATANALMQRDSAGRAKVAAPAASDDIARKDTVDAHANRTDNPHAVTKSQVGLGNVSNKAQLPLDGSDPMTGDLVSPSVVASRSDNPSHVLRNEGQDVATRATMGTTGYFIQRVNPADYLGGWMNDLLHILLDGSEMYNGNGAKFWHEQNLTNPAKTNIDNAFSAAQTMPNLTINYGGIIYAKDVNGNPQEFIKDLNGNTVQLGSASKPNLADYLGNALWTVSNLANPAKTDAANAFSEPQSINNDLTVYQDVIIPSGQITYRGENIPGLRLSGSTPQYWNNSVWGDIWNVNNNGPGRHIPLFSEYVSTTSTSGGNANVTTVYGGNAYSFQDYPVYLDEALRTGRAIYLEVVMHAAGTATAFVALGTNNGTQVTGTQISTASTTFTRVRSGDLSAILNSGNELHLRLWTNNASNSAYLNSARLVIL